MSVSPPPRKTPEIDISTSDNATNHMLADKSNKTSTTASKYLDDFDTYTPDGYMAPKHIYADVADISGAPTTSLIPAHYDVPEAVRTSGVPQPQMNVYEDPKDVLNSGQSASYSNIPNMMGAHYDVPQNSRVEVVASDYQVGGKTVPSQPESGEKVAEEVTANAAHYDVPHKLKDFEASL